MHMIRKGQAGGGGAIRMFGDRFRSSTSCSRWLHETELGRPNPSLSRCFLKVATHPLMVFTSAKSPKEKAA